jgi:hypothetical protein
VTHEHDIISLKDFLDKHPPRIADMKRMIEHIEKSHELLKEWVDKFGESDKELRLRTLNSICHNPL